MATDDTIVPEELDTFHQLAPQADITHLGVKVVYDDGFVEEKLPTKVWAETDCEIDRVIEKLSNGHLGNIFG